eukprot:scaffold1429_cov196-Alexandrium_tamarense.AAC.4
MSRPAISSYVRSESESSGFLSNMLRCALPNQVFLCDATPEEVDFDLHPTGLYVAVHTKQWALVADRVKVYPREACTWVYRMGYEGGGDDNTTLGDNGSSVISPRHSVASPTNSSVVQNNLHGGMRKVMKWRMLPLHASVIFSAPVAVVKALLKAYPGGASAPDDQGALPLHLAFRAGSAEDIVLALLDVYPQAIEHMDNKGRLPSMLAPKVSMCYGDTIGEAFVKGPSYYYFAARVASADRIRNESEMMGKIKLLEENARAEAEHAKEVLESTVDTLNADIEGLLIENTELKEKMAWYESKYDGAEEKEKVLVDHTNSLAERLRLTSLSEEHLATKLAKLESKLATKEQELTELKSVAGEEKSGLAARVASLERELEANQNKTTSLTDKLQRKIKEQNELTVKFDKERQMYEKQIDASKECLMELIASSKEDKKIFDQDSKELRKQLAAMQKELHNSVKSQQQQQQQVPRELEERLDSLTREVMNARSFASHNVNARAEEAEMMVRTSNQMKNSAPASSRTELESECEIYVSQMRDDHSTSYSEGDVDSVTAMALAELTPEQHEALESLDLSGSKVDIERTLAKVPGLTRQQVTLLVDVASSLAA